MQLDKKMIAQSAINGMGTIIMNKVFGEHAEEALRAAEDETVRLEEILSRFIPKSEVSRVNISAGIRFEKLSPDTYEVLSQAIEFSKLCQGCFDITIGPLVTLWKNAEDSCNPPDELLISQAISLVDYSDLVLDYFERTARLKKMGQSIDLGGIGKGFAADKILEVLKQYGISSAFTNLGGNVAAIGAKPDGTPWRVGIQHPRQDNNLIGVVSIVDKTVVTSGDYQRYFIGTNGKRYHHILNPTTGYPSESGLISVTIVANKSLTADALSTILYVAGMDRGIELLKSFPGTEAIFIDNNLLIYITKGLKNCFCANDGAGINVLD